MTILSRLGLQTRLAAAGFNPPFEAWSVADRSYAMPTEGFITGAFSSALWSFQAFFNILKWTEEANDCDDFARIAAGFAQILHFLTPGRPPATGLAVGELWYVKDSGEGHAIIVALCGDKVIAYEPQTCKALELTETEKGRVTMIRF